MSEPMSSSTKRWLILAGLLCVQTLAFVYVVFMQHLQIKDLQGDCEILYARGHKSACHIELLTKSLVEVSARIRGEGVRNGQLHDSGDKGNLLKDHQLHQSIDFLRATAPVKVDSLESNSNK